MSRRKTISKRRTRFFYAVLFLFLITGSNQPVFLSADDKSSADLKKKDESATAETKETESPEVKREKLRKAADAGDAQAQFYLADSYFFGENLSAPDRTLALYWYKKAAAQGLSQAEFNCGLCYEHGYGVKADIWEAVRFYKLA